MTPSPGGAHKDLGTHNALVSLGDSSYFEILARDPAQPCPPRTWMAIDSVTEPQIVAWAAHREDVPAAAAAAITAGYNPGEVASFARPVRWHAAATLALVLRCTTQRTI